jgi:hypothetical protein
MLAVKSEKEKISLFTLPFSWAYPGHSMFQGFIPIEEEDYIWEDPAEITQSEKLFIQ